MIKSKKYLFRKAIFDKLLNWKEIDPKQYWQYLNSLRKDFDFHNNDITTSELKQHFQSQGKTR
jgi:hypothetical protein